ncbi:hypothetical protein SUGI_0257130 [Cryptomeria japonica]|nr:hypothetical protein SUGI_0257130 [Cryptomeria japonica]
MRNSPPSKSSSNVSIRVGASELPTKRKSTTIVGTVLGIVSALAVALGIFSVFIWRRRQTDRYADSSDSFLRMFSYKELKIATRNFKSQLGRGGFGSVFKGSLPDEWIFGLPISTKVDVYSFGMTFLEIISGGRNIDLNMQDSSLIYFPAWAVTQIQQGKTINVVEKDVVEAADMEEVRRACVIVLLCIQEDDEVRPSMRQVVQMLEGKMEPQPPQIPSYSGLLV